MSIRKSGKRKKPDWKVHGPGLTIIFGGLLLGMGTCFLNGGTLSHTMGEVGKAVNLTINNVRSPDNLPEGLTASGYYVIGVNNKASGWAEASRAALLKAISADTSKVDGQIGKYGHNARVFLKTSLPLEPTSKDAEQANIAALNQANPAKSASMFRAVINKYPRFEWPMGNLSSIYLDENELDLAEEMINKSLEINPDYLNGLKNKVALKVRQRKYKEAQAALQHSLDLLGPPEELEHGMREVYDELFQLQAIKLR